MKTEIAIVLAAVIVAGGIALNQRYKVVLIAPGGSSAAAPQATGKLSEEEFLKLTPEAQNKYQEEQFKGKFT